MWFRLFLIAAMLCWVPSMGQAEERSGRSIIDEQYDRHSSENEYGEIKMTLIDRRGKESRREIRAYHLKQDGKSKILIQHLAPANIRGVGLLTWDQGEGREDDQWLYLPASKSIKRIAGGGKKEQFMGSDLAYEDLRVEDLDAHEYTLMGEEEISGRKCWKIESIPSTKDEKKTSGYGKRIMWVDQGHYFNLKVEF